jgi:predicted nuclease of predicted toxin-antitoxin system
MKKALLDEGLSPRTAQMLREDSWDCIHVAEAGLDGASDLEIMRFARESSRVCVTLDHDFHTHLAHLGSVGPSVVFIRIEGLKAAAQASLIRLVWERFEEQLELGVALSVDVAKIRARKLPIVKG